MKTTKFVIVLLYYINYLILTSEGRIVCFSNYDHNFGTCSLESQVVKIDANIPEECCRNSLIAGYAELHDTSLIRNGPPVACNSCNSIRKRGAVYCFSYIWWKRERSCEKIQTTIAESIEECCLKRGYPNDLSAGFAEILHYINRSIPTFHCTYCEEKIVRASLWSKWSECSARCNGGQKVRKWTCKPEILALSIKCYGEYDETQTCNTESCSWKISVIISVVVISIIAGLLIFYFCFWRRHIRKKSPKQSTSRRSIFYTNDFPNDAFVLNNIQNVTRYTRSPERRELPETPTYEMKEEIQPLEVWLNKQNEIQKEGKINKNLYENDPHTYEDIDKCTYTNVDTTDNYLLMK